MAKFISSRNPISTGALKRKPIGAVVTRHHGKWEDIKFTRITGGWLRERTDVTSEKPTVVSSVDVADECNSAVGCKESWAKVY